MQEENHRPFLRRSVTGRHEDGVFVTARVIPEDPRLKSGPLLLLLRARGRRRRQHDRHDADEWQPASILRCLSHAVHGRPHYFTRHKHDVTQPS
jgi:hypothetical protein